MKLVITDGATLNPGDLSWAPLAAFGEIVYHDTTPVELVTERCGDADIIVSNKTIVSRETIQSARHLKMIAVTATGYNNIDVAAAREAGIVVCNVPEYGTFSVAQHVFALLLELVNHVGMNAESTRNNGWTKAGTWSYTKKPVRELKDKVLGIVGFGRIGKQVAIIARAFGMKVIFNNRSVISDKDAEQVSMEKLFSDSDVITLHCPLTDGNRHFVDLRLLSMMKPGAILINTSRGPLINEEALYTALQNKMLAGAALDVLSEEPPPAGHPLIDHPNCIVTPHTAWISVEARARLLQQTVNNIDGFLKGIVKNNIIS